ncbi:MAG: TlpA family protein disulfide reductase [Thermoguttaceae bacterium]|nr:TlpA family protein disulfide reductase [Thermoguttaceae bacterium]MBP3693532.1 TlpA family protein disulfide reductase [Thermoguttaceae bacterium]
MKKFIHSINQAKKSFVFHFPKLLIATGMLSFSCMSAFTAEGDRGGDDFTPTLVGPLSMPSVVTGEPAKSVESSPVEAANPGTLFHPQRQPSKNLWADSWLFMPVPLLDSRGKIQEENEATENLTAKERLEKFILVDEWYGAAPPSLEGKYVLVDFSASWCPACRREIVELNHWFEKFGEELIVISIYETDRVSIDNLSGQYKGKDLKYYVGIDMKRRTANALGVFGIPHAVLVEPLYGGVIWEGMPNQPGYELTDEIIEKVLSVGRRMNAQK